MPSVSVCIATYRRPSRLRLLLHDLALQSQPPRQVVVVDNDGEASARATVQVTAEAGMPFDLWYEVEPERGIAVARNRTVALAHGDWLAFVDDDERVPPDWLQRSLAAAGTYAADGILGPIVPSVPSNAASWLRRGRFYDTPRWSTGTLVPANRLRFGNALLRGDLMRAERGPFDTSYGLATGEDGDLLLRLVAGGARVVWCDEAVVEEPIEPARLSLRWLLQRAYSRGQEFGRKTLAGRYGTMTPGTRSRFFVDAAAKLSVASALSVGTLPLGRDRAAQWLVRGAANLGKLTAFPGWRYEEYHRASVSDVAETVAARRR